MKKTYYVQEYETLYMTEQLSEIDLQQLNQLARTKEDGEQYRFMVDELKEQMRLQFTSYVGVIELETIRIVIQPKFDATFERLTDMIAFSQTGIVLQMNGGQGQIGENTLFTRLIHYYVQEVQKVMRKGLKKEYVEQISNQYQLRGRIKITENMRYNYHVPTKLYCEYDELTYDITENQQIVTVLQKIFAYPLPIDVRRSISQLLTHLQGIRQLASNTIAITYDRTNQHYKRAHQLGNFIMHHLFITNPLTTKQTPFAFLVNMNAVFEHFIRQLCQSFLPKTYTVHYTKRIRNAIMLNQQTYRQIEPDLLIQHHPTNEYVVIDAKYKGYGQQKVVNTDIYQLVFYAQYFQIDKLYYEATIIYPAYSKDEENSKTIDINAKNQPLGKIHVKSIAIEQVVEWLQQDNQKALTAYVLAWVV